MDAGSVGTMSVLIINAAFMGVLAIMKVIKKSNCGNCSFETVNNNTMPTNKTPLL